MNSPVSIMALFCEDIREEKNGVHTLIGIMPDNVNVKKMQDASHGDTAPESTSAFLGKLCIYLRVNFDLTESLGEISLRLIHPDGDITPLESLTLATIEEAKRKAKEHGVPMAGIVSRMVFVGLDLSKPGSLKLEAGIGDNAFIAGAISIKIIDSDG